MKKDMKKRALLNKLENAIGVVLMLFFFISCSEEMNEPIGSDMTVPAKVTGIEYTAIPGGAHITYALPTDANLLCVTAELVTSRGNKLSFTSSSYKNEITILGLPTEDAQKVLLYSVTTNGVRSEAATISITPYTPPYKAVLETLKMQTSWGGINVSYQNESAADLAYYLGYFDDKGDFIEYGSYYSNQEKESFAFRGLEDKERKFGIYIRDRWDNYSDTIFQTITPLREVMLDKAKFRMLQLDGDGIYGTSNNEQPENLWNGVWGTEWGNNYGDWKHFIAQDKYGEQEDATFTMDIGSLTQLSRMVMNQYYRYDNHMPKKYNIYGLVGYDDDLVPSSMGDWSNWTLLAEVENKKEFSTAIGPNDATAVDIQNWLKGDHVNFDPEPSPPVRYIRFRCLESWNGRHNISLAEVTYWGNPKE